MTEASRNISDWCSRTGEWLMLLSRGAALLGVVVLVLLSIMMAVSITGRWLAGVPSITALGTWIGSLPGDFELMEHGTAAAIFLFLPYCQLNRAHVAVDLVMSHASERVKAVVELAVNILFTGVAGLLTRYLYLGMLDKMGHNETTMMLKIPVWYGYALAVTLLAFLTVVCGYTIVEAARDLKRHFAIGRALSAIDEVGK